MVHRDPQRSRGRLGQTPAARRPDLGGELSLLLAGSTHPSAEPLRHQLGLRGAQAPGARPDEHLGAAPAELLDGDPHRVRAEQARRAR